MERRKHRGSCDDELALVKAAAWAWFQHGLGSDGNLNMPESDIRRACHGPCKPSRYKLEAMANFSDKQGREFAGLKLKPPSVYDNSLLDTYEIESISRKLDQLIESSGDKDKIYKGFRFRDVLTTKKGDKDKIYKGFRFGDVLTTKMGVKRSKVDINCMNKCSDLLLNLQARDFVGDLRRQEGVPLLMEGNTSERKKKQSKNVPKWFWHRHGAICGGSEDVLNTTAFMRSRRRPEIGGYLPVVKGV